MLDDEIRFYGESLEEWMKLYPGRVVLVKGSRLVGVFDNESGAIEEGARLFGLVPYLVRRVAHEQAGVCIPALAAGVLHADP